MRKKTTIKLREQATGLAVQWLSKLVPENEVANITPESIRLFEATQDKYVYGNGIRRWSVYSTKWFYKKLKKHYKSKTVPSFVVSLEQLG